MNSRQNENFEWRYGPRKFPCADLEDAHIRRERYEIYSAACQDEAEAVKGLVEALEELQRWKDAYPPEQFAPLTKEERELAIKLVPFDRINAAAMLHVATKHAEIAAAALKAWKGE